MRLGHSSLLSDSIRDPVLSPYRPQDRPDRKMRNYEIGLTETKLPYIFDIEEGLLVFLMFYTRRTLEIVGNSLLSPSHNYLYDRQEHELDEKGKKGRGRR